MSSSHLRRGGEGTGTKASASLQLTVSLGKSRRAESEGMAEKPLSLGVQGCSGRLVEDGVDLGLRQSPGMFWNVGASGCWFFVVFFFFNF